MRIYQRLTDGSPIADVSPFLDGDILAARGVPETAVDGDGVLLLQPGRFTTLGVAAGDLVGLRVTAHGFELATVYARGFKGLSASRNDPVHATPPWASGSTTSRPAGPCAHPGAPRSADATSTPASITESLAVLPVASFAGPSVLLGLVDCDDDGRGGLFSALPL